MTIDYQNVVFAFDMNRIVTVGGVRYLFDYGPHGFHFAFPGGAADPTPQLDGSLSFDGNDYLYLPASRMPKFYEKAPVGELTFLFVESSVSRTTFNSIFSNYTVAGGLNYGYDFRTSNGGATELYCYRATAAVPRVQSTGFYSGNLRRYVTAMTVEATTRWMANQSTIASTWAGGAFGPVVHDTTTVPRIGSIPSGGLYFNGRVRFLSIIRGAVSSADLMFYSRLLSEGTKPWCVRR